MTVDNTPIIIIVLQDMLHWFSLHEIPNSFTLVIEVIIGIAIAVIVFGLQSKTDKSNEAVISKMNEATQKIDIYIEGKKKLEETTKRFYVDMIINNLLYIKHQDQKAMEVVRKFQQDNQLPDRETMFWIYSNWSHIRIFCISERSC